MRTMRSVTAAVMVATCLAGAGDATTAWARPHVLTVAGRPKTFIGRMSRGTLRLGSGVARWGGLGAMVAGAVMLDPTLLTMGLGASIAGDVGGDLAHSWGGTRVDRSGRPVARLRGVAGVASGTARAGSFVARKGGTAAFMFGLATLNPVLMGGGAATWLGGRIVRGIEHRLVLRASRTRTR